MSFRSNLPGTRFRGQQRLFGCVYGRARASATPSTTSSLRGRPGKHQRPGWRRCGWIVPGNATRSAKRPACDRSRWTHGVDGPHQIWVEAGGDGMTPHYVEDFRPVISHLRRSTGNRLVFCPAVRTGKAAEADVEADRADRSVLRFTPTLNPGCWTNEAGRSHRGRPASAWSRERPSGRDSEFGEEVEIVGLIEAIGATHARAVRAVAE